MAEQELEADFWGDVQVASPKKKKKKRSRPAVHVFLLLLVLFTAFGYLGYQLSDSWLSEGLSIARGGGDGGTDLPGAAPSSEDSEKLTLLLMGVDRRDNEAARADTIMVAFIDLESDRASLLSIPRDTYVEVPGHGRTKINHAHAYGGAELMTETVSGFLSVPVNKYAEIDFQGFVNVVDTLGGVTMDVEQRMYYPAEDIDLQAGEQRLDGEEALQYVRYRGREGDIGRIERQQKFMTVMTDQTISLGTVIKLPSLLKTVQENTETNLSFKELLGLAKIAGDVRSGSLETAMVPGEPVYINQVSYWRPYTEETQDMVNQFLARNDA